MNKQNKEVVEVEAIAPTLEKKDYILLSGKAIYYRLRLFLEGYEKLRKSNKYIILRLNDLEFSNLIEFLNSESSIKDTVYCEITINRILNCDDTMPVDVKKITKQ
jgi:hypothetical protein